MSASEARLDQMAAFFNELDESELEVELRKASKSPPPPKPGELADATRPPAERAARTHASAAAAAPTSGCAPVAW